MTFGHIIELFFTALFVVFFFGLCIVVHEFGHLLAALRRGLHVERFSIGFGKKMWGFTRDGVEYWVSWIPFGGYVALPQLEPSEEPMATDGRKLPHVKPLDRIITAFAGPFFNVLFGFFLAVFVWWMGVYRPGVATHCDVLTVPETCPEYQAGLRPEDRITAVNGKGFKRGWHDLAEAIMLSPGEVTLAVIDRTGQSKEIRYRPAANKELEGLGMPFFRVRTPTVVHEVMPGYPGAAAGLKKGDLILSFNDTPVEDAGAFIDLVRQTAGQPFTLKLRRNGAPLTLRDIKPQADTVEGQTVYRIGAVIDAPYVLTHPTPWEQFTGVITKTGETLRPLFTRGSLVKPKHMSGPVGIAQMIGVKVYSEGFRGGLAFIVFITFSLAIFNLLPLPVLDGGHITMALIEMVARRPVPVFVARWLTYVFASLLITFMLYVTFYDVKRTGLIMKYFRTSNTEQVRETTPPAAKPAAPPVSPAPATGTAGNESPVAQP